MSDRVYSSPPLEIEQPLDSELAGHWVALSDGSVIRDRRIAKRDRRRRDLGWRRFIDWLDLTEFENGRQFIADRERRRA